ncbi:MAG: hydroxyacid dehydrogenase [Candidatus Bathyarchaeia archaeon]
MAKVLICDRLDDEGVELLRKEGHEVDVKLNLTPQQLQETVTDYDAVIVRSRTKITSNIIDAMQKTRIIARAGTGLDNIDVAAAEKRKITVLNSPEAVAQSAAELTLGLMFSLARQIPQADALTKQGKWPKGQLEGHQLAGKTLGIVGIGRIGAKVALVAKALGMRIFAYDVARYEQLERELGVEWVPLDRLLKEADVVSLHLPLTSETKGIISGEQLALMKPTTLLVNAARGGLVDEQALLEALSNGRLAGAALDVYEVEPPVNMKLLQLPNFISTPHIGAQTVEAQKKASVTIAQKVRDALRSL